MNLINPIAACVGVLARQKALRRRTLASSLRNKAGRQPPLQAAPLPPLLLVLRPISIQDVHKLEGVPPHHLFFK